MIRARRRQADRLRAEIMDGIAEYVEDRSSRASIARCGTLIEDGPARRVLFDRFDRNSLCGMHADLALALLAMRSDRDLHLFFPEPASQSMPSFLH